jgi:hypothetical protein
MRNNNPWYYALIFAFSRSETIAFNLLRENHEEKKDARVPAEHHQENHSKKGIARNRSSC